MRNVVACGLTTIDIVYRVARFPGGNEKITATSATVDVGGPAANAARTAALLGAPTTLVSRLGAGPLAGVAGAALRAAGVVVVDVTPRDSGWLLPVSSVMVDPVGQRSVVSRNAADAPMPVPVTRPSPPGVLLIDGHDLTTAERFLGSAAASERPSTGRTVVVLDGGSWKPGLERVLSWVHVAIVSADFHPPEPFAPLLAAVPFVARSDGDRPIRLELPVAQRAIPVPRVQVVDTLGAGDVLHGAFAHAIAAAGVDAGELTADLVAGALTQAAATASRSCAGPGVLAWQGPES